MCLDIRELAFSLSPGGCPHSVVTPLGTGKMQAGFMMSRLGAILRYVSFCDMLCRLSIISISACEGACYDFYGTYHTGGVYGVETVLNGLLLVVGPEGIPLELYFSETSIMILRV